MPDPSQGVPAPGTYLGIDFGRRRIGVAVGQTTTATARPLAVIPNGAQPDWQALERLLREWRPAGIVIGLPLDADGADTPMSREARAFGRQLGQRGACAVHYNDERLTSMAAQEQFRQRRSGGQARRADAAMLDAMAAAIILENWLQG